MLFCALMGIEVCLSAPICEQWEHILSAKLKKKNATTSSQLFFSQLRLFPEQVTWRQPLLSGTEDWQL